MESEYLKEAQDDLRQVSLAGHRKKAGELI
jgi:hypothetical protein